MGGIEWVVEAFGCAPARLRDLPGLRALFEKMVREMALRPVGEPLWHQFPRTGGITALYLLAESHLTCHTFPEHRSLCLNLFCCVPRPEWDFKSELRQALGAERVSVRRLQRPYESLQEQVGA
jgi:S-adenosylmethionine decarboxylase